MAARDIYDINEIPDSEDERLQEAPERSLQPSKPVIHDLSPSPEAARTVEANKQTIVLESSQETRKASYKLTSEATVAAHAPNNTRKLKRKIEIDLISDDEETAAEDELLRRPDVKKARTVEREMPGAFGKEKACVTKEPTEQSRTVRSTSMEALEVNEKPSGQGLKAFMKDRKAQEAARQARNAMKEKEQALKASGKDVAGPAYVDRFHAVKTVSPVSGGASSRNAVSLEDQPETVPKTTVLEFKDRFGPVYTTGVVKKTFLNNKERTPDDIKIEEVLQKETLVGAVLSAMQWDYEWIWAKLPNLANRAVFVMQAKTSEERAEAKRVFERLGVELVFPKMDGQVNIMHSKLMLLFHKAGDIQWLRIAVPTANLMDYDWGYMGGVMENMVFLIDLPMLDIPLPDQTPFMTSLIEFCNASDYPEKILNRLAYYDFSATKEFAFVHTIGGSHGEDSWMKTGYPGLATAINTLGYSSGKGLEIDFVTSSLGATKEDFISNIYRAAQGFTGIDELQRRNKKIIKVSQSVKAAKSDFFSSKSTATCARKNDPDETESDSETVPSVPEVTEEKDWARIKERFRIYFPSKQTVASSRGGENCAGTICFNRKWWNDQTFPKELVRDCRSRRPGLLMHNKILFARPAHTIDSPQGKIKAWAYVGSANLSESAWGKLVVDRTKNTPKLNCKNWECGVVVPVRIVEKGGRTLSGKAPEVACPVEMNAFESVVPVPMEYPAEGLKETKREPWFFMENN